MKRILLVFCLMLTVLCATATEKVKVGSFWYEVNNDKTYATVIAAQQGEDSYSGSITIPSSIPVKVSENPEEYVQVPVTIIGSNAFRNTTITDVTIPASITKIGSSAFDNCSYIEKATFASIQALCEIEFANYLSHPLSSAENGALFIGNSTTEETDLVIPEGITRIRAYCFYNCKHITSVTIPSTLTTVGTNAFSRATGLTKVSFASTASLCAIDYDAIYSNPIYYAHNLYIGTTPLTNLTIPESSLKNGNTVKRYILAGATGLIKVVLPSAVKKIELQAFEGCTGLQYADYANLDQVLDMDYSGSLTANPMYYAKQLLINNTFASNLTIDKNLKDGAFVNAKWLENVTIKEGVKSIGTSAFEGCSNLNLITLPSTLQTIGARAFWSCNKLQAPTLPNALQSIGEAAFHDCKSGSFKEIKIPDYCTLGNEVFYSCANLEKVTLPAGLESIGQYCFDKCYNLQDINLPTSVTAIGNYAFRDCRKLTKFPSGGAVTSIGENAFAGCTGITSLILPEPVNTIKANAFSGCTNMTTLSLPASTEYIMDNAFSRCTALIDVFCLSSTVPTVASNSFGNQEAGMTLYVVDATAKTNYEVANVWKNFKNINVKEEHSLTFYINDAEVKKIKQDAGTAILESAVPKPTLGEGDEFSGWSESIPNTMPIEDKKFYGYVSMLREIDGYQYRLMPKEELNGNNLPNRAELLTVKKELTADDKIITIPEKVTYSESNYQVIAIGANAFEGQTIIEQIILPSSKSITQIGDAAFKGCTNLLHIDNFDAITEINDQTFYNCKKLAVLTLSDNLTKIGNLAFANSGIENLTLIRNLGQVGQEAFKGCSKLKALTCEDGFSLPIPKMAFMNCTALETITLTGTTDAIQESAFQGCTKLSSLVIPEGITSIGSSAFSGCNQLTSITLPSTVLGLNTKAFANCNALRQITIDSEEPPIAPNDVFSTNTYDNAYLYVQDVSKYSGTDPWKKFSPRITKKEEFTLTYMVNGTEYKKYENVMVGTLIQSEPTPTGEGYDGHVFSEWQGEPDVMPAENITVVGNFQYEIKFYENSVADNNQLLKNEEYKFFYGDKVVLPVEELNKAGFKYTLTGLTTESIYEDDAANLDMTMPAKDLNVIVTYQTAEANVAANGINYKVFMLENRAEVISGTATATSVTIPATVSYNSKNYPVTVIRAGAFKEYKKLTTVTINNSVKTIGDEAFNGCSALSSINMPATLDSIGQQVFANNTALTSVTVPYAPKMGKEIFYWCLKLNNISFSQGLTKLPERMFQGCTNLNEVVLPDQITEIGNYCFAGCKNISSFTLKSSVKKIGAYAFYGVFGKDDILEVEGSTLPTATANTFDEDAYKYALLKTSASTTDEPWKNFENVEGSTTAQCAAPVIVYAGGKLKFSTTTPGATIISSITIDDAGDHTQNEVVLSKNYIVRAYAKKDGMRRSATVTKTFQFMNGDVNLDGEIDIADVQLVINRAIHKIDALAPKLEVEIEPEQDTLDPQ